MDQRCQSCLNGTYANSFNNTCDECQPGFECIDGLLVPCDVGQYSTNGTCYDCPVGFYCTRPDHAPQPCPNGLPCQNTLINEAFDANMDYNETVNCPLDHTCNEFDIKSRCKTNEVSLVGENSCQTCPLNLFANKLSGLCEDCPAGYSCKNNTLSICKPGLYSLIGEMTCTICPSKYFCPTSSVVLECPTSALSIHGVTECEYVQTKKSRSKRFVELTCLTDPPEFVTETNQCDDCPPGSISDGKLCRSCTPGTYVENGACKQCGANTVPNNDFTGCETCPANEYPNIDQSTCQTCPNGYSCIDGIKVICELGSHSNGLECESCKAGEFCPSPYISEPMSCPAGTYSEDNYSLCLPCPAGITCPSKTSCEDGTYSVLGSDTCIDCPAGYYCPDRAKKLIIPCPDGSHSSGKQSSCKSCDEGFECTSDGTESQCALGFYSPIGSNMCTKCPMGQACPAGSGAPVGCSAGNYILNDACAPCGDGYYCPKNSQSEHICPLGKKPNNDNDGCVYCSSGKYCTIEDSGTVENDCTQGHYCPTGSHTELECPPGSYSITPNNDSRKKCLICNSGSCCEGRANTALTQCPIGYFCPPDVTGVDVCRKYPCPAGTYGNTAGLTKYEDCTNCPAGKWCPEGTIGPLAQVPDCPKGFFCSLKDTNAYDNSCDAGTFIQNGGQSDTDKSNCVDCPNGYYCPKGSQNYPGTKQFPCPSGTYVQPSDIKFESVHQCRVCPEGKYCSESPTISLSASLPDCPFGFYCTFGTKGPTSFPCAAGTYLDTPGGTSADDCKKCPDGKYCLQGTGGEVNDPLAKSIMNCNPGFYCPAGSPSGNLNPCPPGTYSTSVNLSKPDECTNCPEGYYCIGGESTPTGYCPPGHYCLANTVSKYQHPCAAGLYQPLFNQVNAGSCKSCPTGHFCEAGVTVPIPCPFGTYMNTEKNTAKKLCSSCTAGNFCGTGTDEPSECIEGYYSKEGWSSCQPCLAGYFCDTNGTTYDDMITENRCTDGRNCEEGTIDQTLDADVCERGFVCVDGVTDAIPCPPGTYQPNKGMSKLRLPGGLSDCIKCPAGYFCQEAAWHYNTNYECDKGFYCPDDIPNPYALELEGIDDTTYGPDIIGSYGPQQAPCPAGTYSDERGTKTMEDCKDCSEGYYCPQGSPEEIACPLGFYCPATIGKPEPCPVGTFGEKLFLTSEDECTDCTKGYYCDSVGLLQPRGACDPGYLCLLGASVSAPTDDVTGSICPEGGYCPSGSYEPWACPPGTFADTPGQVDASDCQPCTPGFYCSGSNSATVSGECQAGCYCDGESYYECQDPCPAGHYCPTGTPEPIECPAGTYQPQDRQEYCLPCPPGFYCPNLKTIVPVIGDAGYYCDIE